MKEQNGNGGKWKCLKCKTDNAPQVSRCSWCHTPRPKE